MDEVEGAGDSAVSATAADEGDALEAAGFACHFRRRLGSSGLALRRGFATSYWLVLFRSVPKQ